MGLQGLSRPGRASHGTFWILTVMGLGLLGGCIRDEGTQPSSQASVSVVRKFWSILHAELQLEKNRQRSGTLLAAGCSPQGHRLLPHKGAQTQSCARRTWPPGGPKEKRWEMAEPRIHSLLIPLEHRKGRPTHAPLHGSFTCMSASSQAPGRPGSYPGARFLGHSASCILPVEGMPSVTTK